MKTVTTIFSFVAAAILLAACGTSPASNAGPTAPSGGPSAPSAVVNPPAVQTSVGVSSPGPAQSSASPSASTGPAQARALSQSSVRFAIPVSSGLQVLPQLAEEAGYFKEEGLEVSITPIPGSPDVIAALGSGGLDMANSDSPSVIQAHMSGAPVQIVAVPVTKPIFDFMVSPEITKPEDLKGKTIGVTRICDSTCFQISRALQSWGLDPKTDVQFLSLRDYPGMYAALTNNQIAGSPLAPPFNVQAQNKGYHSLADLSQLPIEYPTAVVQTSVTFATAHPDTVEAFLRAYVKAIHRYKTDEAFTVDVYRRFLKSDDTPVLEQTWDYYRRLMQDDPTPTATGVKFVLDSLAETGEPRAASANPADFIQPRFIEDIKASGGLNP